MPSAIEYIPPTDKTRGSFNTALQTEVQARRAKYKLALEYYLGEQEYPFPDDEKQDSKDATIVNMVKMTADRTAEFLFSSIPRFELDPTVPDDTPEEAWIKEFFEANDGMTSLAKLALRGFLSGHCFVQVKPVPEQKRNSVKPQYPQMLILDPTSISVYWSADDVGDVLWYEKRYYVGDTLYIQDFVKDVDQWVIFTYKTPLPSLSVWQEIPTLHGGLWNVDFEHSLFEPMGKPAYHKSDVPPIIEWPHLPHPDSRYGLGEFTNKSLADTINRIASARNRIVSENSEPTDILTGADVGEIQDSGPIIAIPNAAAKVQRLEMKGDLTAISLVLKEMIETYLAIARVVLLKGEAKDLQRVTNASVRTLFLDMLAKNNLLQYAYGKGLKQIVLVALQMAFEMGAKMNGVALKNPVDIDIELKWDSPLPTDATEIANVAALLVNMGAMSKRTAATQSGLEWSFEQGAMESEKKVAMEDAKAQLQMQAEMAPQPNPNDPNQGNSKTPKTDPLTPPKK